MHMNKKASQVLDEMYKKAKMDVPSEEEKKNINVPEKYIDVAVCDEKGGKDKISKKDAETILAHLGYVK